MGSKKNVDMAQTESTVKIIKTEENQEKKTLAETKQKAVKDPASPKKTQKIIKQSKKRRGKKYQAVRAQLDKTKTYDLDQAITLVKKFSYTKFDASVEAHLVVKEEGTSVSLTLPHKTGKNVKVVIADEQLLAAIEQGKIDFDVLLASPELMPKLAKLAKILGPKGLMPNPKNGTLTPNPELKKKEFEAGTFTLKTEKKAPLMHLVVGKVSMDKQLLKENLLAVIKALKNKLVKIVIAPSMGPAIKINYQLELEEKNKATKKTR